MMRAAAGGDATVDRARALLRPGLSQAPGRRRRRGGAGADGRDAPNRRGRSSRPAASRRAARAAMPGTSPARRATASRGDYYGARRRQPPGHRPDRDGRRRSRMRARSPRSTASTWSSSGRPTSPAASACRARPARRRSRR